MILAKMVRRAMRSGLTNHSSEDVNKSLFTSNTQHARNPSDFKLPTLEKYDGKTDRTVHLMRYIRHREVSGVSEEVMGWCFLLYLTDLTTLWFRQLDNGSISTCAELVHKFMEQFRVHISRPKNVMTLSSVKKRTGETVRSFLISFNAIAAAVDRPDPSVVLMAGVSRVTSKADFKVDLERDPPIDLFEFYHEEDVEAEKEEINAVDGGVSSRAGSDKDEGK